MKASVSKREYAAGTVDEEVIPREHLGIGTTDTWHGSPDCRCDIDIINVDTVEEVVDSSGAKTLIEMKRPPLNSAHLNQVIGNSVTYSFVHKNRHPTQNTLVPVVGISGSTGMLLMAAYDCARDVLIYTQPHPWFNTRTAAFVEDGLLLLWLCLHHRIFLKEFSGSKPCSELHGRFRRDGVLERFSSLRRMNVSYWSQVEFLRGVKRKGPTLRARDMPIMSHLSSISCTFAYETACNTSYLHVIVYMLWSLLLFVINDLRCLLTKCDIIRSECMIAFVRSMTSPCPT